VPLGRPILVNGINVEFFPVLNIHVSLLRRFAFSWPLAKAVLRRVKEFDIVHIHSLYLFPALATSYSCRAAGVPYIISPDGILDPFTHRKNRIIKNFYLALFARRDLNHAAAVHFMTQGELEWAKPFGVTAPAFVVNWGIDLPKYRRIPLPGAFSSRYPEVAGKRLIVYLGRITYSKGLDLLARAFSRVARTHQDTYLVLVGPDREGYGAKVQRLLGEEGVLERTIFTGMVSEQEKIEALWAAEVFVLPSYVEGFGIAMIEAMACERPVVITRGSCMQNEVAQADAGLVVNCEVDDLAHALTGILDDPEHGKRMGQNGRNLVEAKFTWPRVAEEMLNAYEGIVKCHN
jgi:glycosyltransferase involved in cell wall biosynthesis